MRHMDPIAYLSWYYRTKTTSGFTSLEDFIETIGPRPGPTFTLTHLPDGGVLTPENFLWITKEAITQAKNGIIAPPQMDTPQRQAVNDPRFAQYTKPSLEFVRGRIERLERRRKTQEDITRLIAHITDYVVSKGFSEAEALNPEILSENGKLQAARAKVQELIDSLTGAAQTQRTRDYLAQKTREKRELAKFHSAQNRVHSGKPGRPIERWIKIRVPITQLTPLQRQQHEPPIPPNADHIYLLNPTSGKTTKRRTAWVTVPNPKAAPFSSDTGHISMDTRIDNV